MNSLSQRQKYAPVSIALHWITVILMLLIYASIELHEVIAEGNSLRGAMEDWHIYLGLCMLPLGVYRLVINLKMQPPGIMPRPP